MELIKKHPYVCIMVILCVINAVLWNVVYESRNTGILTVAFLNIGQGDAIYIESPDHHQLIIDGGPDNSLLGEVRKMMPWYDRSIDMIMVTNPDKDHFAGFIPLIDRYKVDADIESGTTNPSDIYAALEKTVGAHHLEKITAHRGQILDLGSGVFLHILFPDRDVSKLDSNPGSIIAKLIYGSTSVMFTGDAPKETEEYVVDLDGSTVQSTILKEGHHGSRTSASEKFFRAVNPEFDIISAGYHNKYSHPHKETTDLLRQLHIPTLITYKEGTIVFTSDGKNFIRKN